MKSPAYWREHYQIDTMPLTDGDGSNAVRVNNGHIVRVRRHDYCLRADSITTRARWGTAEQIAEDIAYLDQWATLPQAKNRGGW